jgi:hypothetical protein
MIKKVVFLVIMIKITFVLFSFIPYLFFKSRFDNATIIGYPLIYYTSFWMRGNEYKNHSFEMGCFLLDFLFISLLVILIYFLVNYYYKNIK